MPGRGGRPWDGSQISAMLLRAPALRGMSTRADVRGIWGELVLIRSRLGTRTTLPAMFALSFIFLVFGRWSRNASQLLLRRDCPAALFPKRFTGQRMDSFPFGLAVIAAQSVGEVAVFLPGTMGLRMGRVEGGKVVWEPAACVP